MEMAAVMLTTKYKSKREVIKRLLARCRRFRRFQIRCFEIAEINFFQFGLAFLLCLSHRNGTDVSVLVNIIVDPNVDVQIQLSVFCLR